MRNRKFVKPLLIVVAMILVCIMSVFATLAYLTAGDTVKNTFTVGNITIDLNEAKVDEYGNPVYKTDEDGEFILDEEGNKILEDRVDGNKYKLVPNREYTKDPTITVDKMSEDCYLRAIITVTKGKALADLDYTADFDPATPAINVTEAFQFEWGEGWSVHDVNYDNNGTTDNTADDVYVIEARYANKVLYNKDADQIFKVFTHFTTPDVTNTELATLEGMEITVNAQAIQADTFANAAAAFAALDNAVANA